MHWHFRFQVSWLLALQVWLSGIPFKQHSSSSGHGTFEKWKAIAFRLKPQFPHPEFTPFSGSHGAADLRACTYITQPRLVCMARRRDAHYPPGSLFDAC